MSFSRFRHEGSENRCKNTKKRVCQQHFKVKNSHNNIKRLNFAAEK